MTQKPLGSVLMAVVVGAVVLPITVVRAEAAGQSTRATTQTSGTVQGSIIAVNLDKRRLQIREQDGRIVTVPIDPAAKIMREGRASTLNDLSVGQQITVQQADRNGQSMATSIEVMAARSTGAGSNALDQQPNRGLQSVPGTSSTAPSSPNAGALDSSSSSSSTTTVPSTGSSSAPSTSTRSSTGMGSSTTAPSAGTSGSGANSGSSMSGAGSTGTSSNPR